MASTWCRFLLESLGELQHRLAAHGSDLHFLLGSPDSAIAAVLRAVAPAASRVDLYHHLGISSRAISEEDAVLGAFLGCGGELGVACEVHRAWGGHTLFHPEDALPALHAARSKRAGRRGVWNRDSPAEPCAVDAAAFQLVPPVMTDFRKACHLCPIASCVGDPYD